MLGITLVKDPDKEPVADEAKALVAYCAENFLIILSCGMYGNVIRTPIPFVITDNELEKGLSILEQCLSKISN